MTDQNGLNQKVIDMGEAIAQLKTDMEWVKAMLVEIRKSLDRKDDEFSSLVRQYQEQVDKRLDDHEARIQDLETFRDRVKGVAVAVSALASSGVIAYIISKLFGL